MTETDWKTIARNLMAARLAAGYRSATAGAKAAGVHQRTYADHEAGKREFPSYLAKYAKAYGTTVEAILYGDKDAQLLEGIPHLQLAELAARDPLELLFRSGHGNALSVFNLGPHVFTVTNPDRAMSPVFLPGDILCFDADLALLRAEEGVLVRLPREPEPLFRIYSPHIGNGVILAAINPIVAEINAQRSEFAILGRLIFIMRSAGILTF